MSAPGYLDLGGIIAALEAEDPRRVLPLGFDNPHSYRGYYDQLAFEPAANISIRAMLAAARSAVGATYEGWKGGDYTMTANTDCWLANEGDCSDDRIGPVLLSLLLAQPAVELEEEPQLPPEPPVDSLVGSDGSARPRHLFLHQPTTGAPELGPDAYYDLFHHTRTDWAGVLRAVPEPVQWVPAPLLAELIEALSADADALHEDQHLGSFSTCDNPQCRDRRALLAKVTGEVAA